MEADGITKDKLFHEKYRIDTRTRGIQIADIAAGLNNYLGSSTYKVNYYVSSPDELVSIVTDSLKLLKPVIASVYWNAGHYVVIYGIYYNNGTAYFMIKDPAKSAGTTVKKSASEFYDSMPYPNNENGNAHPILYGSADMYNPLYSYDFVIPSSVSDVGEEAFYGIKTQMIYVTDGVASIGKRAFAEVSSLRAVYIPVSCKSIASDAFSGNTHMIIFGAAGSIAETYARQNSIPFSTVPSLSTRIRQYILAEPENRRYSIRMDLDQNGKIDSMDYILARKKEM